jgi:hypothetical protein
MYYSKELDQDAVEADRNQDRLKTTSTTMEPKPCKIYTPSPYGPPTSPSTTTNPGLKRKAPSRSTVQQPLSKLAKSTHDSKPWPRHLYMECARITPVFKGDVGTLHIDLGESMTWFEG